MTKPKLEINNQIATSWLHEVAEEVFNNELPLSDITIDVQYSPTAWGNCSINPVTGNICIGLSPDHKTVKKAKETLVHELIHALQFYNEQDVTHDGLLWTIWTRVARQYGYNIQKEQ